MRQDDFDERVILHHVLGNRRQVMDGTTCGSGRSVRVFGMGARVGSGGLGVGVALLSHSKFLQRPFTKVSSRTNLSTYP